MPQYEVYVKDITITPDPVVLGPADVEALIEVDTAGEARVSGTLAAPDGSRRRLDLDPGPEPLTWRARHRFRVGDLTGVWRLEVMVDGVVTEQDLLVLGDPPSGEVRFAEFDVEPREIEAGDDMLATGRLVVVDGGTVRPFGGQPVSITHRAGDGDAWEEIGEAVTEWDSGEFSTEISPGSTGEVRAELPADLAKNVHSRAVAVAVLFPRIHPPIDLRLQPPRAATVGGRSCYLHHGTAEFASGGDVGSGSVRIEYRKRVGGQWIRAKGPGGQGRAVGPVNGGVFDVFSQRKSRVTWRAVFM
ncbi:hypothetical protein [Nonomuraea lactucae]|uniref:hypothetical protein n=1 Tax=Nonomuraea lactucae TaxID=2249762 RepID=UPI000DE2596F|nr:hypothetical protein [Nonomuraea lactucae]